jgi:hypothetical protein
MQLKIKQGVDLKKYGFVRYNKTDNDCYKVCSKDGLGIVVTVIGGVLSFWAEVDRIPPNTENYFTLDDNAFDEETFRDDVSDLLCEEVELKTFETLLGRLIEDNVVEVINTGE